MKDDERLIPSRLEPDPVEIEFERVESALPGLTLRRGEYATNQGVKLVLFAAAQREHARELDGEFLGGLKFWAEMVEGEETVLADEDEPCDLAEFTREVIEDQRALHFALQVGTAERNDSRFVWLVDKPIADNRVHWYMGGDSVCVSINSGAVRFRRPNYDPLDVPGTKRRPAPRGCSIRALRNSDYNIEGAGRLWNNTPA
jgi:hypothetical protein